jgi:cardiolipin synthase
VVTGRDREDASIAPPDLPVDHSRDVFSVPNLITVTRLALVPFFYWFLVYAAPVGGRNDAAFGLFTLCAATDWLDGLIARRSGRVTVIGKVIDPLVDRVLIASAVIGVYVVGRVSLVLVILLVGRDVYLLYGAWVLERQGRRIPVTALGKVTTAVLLTGFASLIWDFPLVRLPQIAGAGPLATIVPIGGVRPLGTYIVYVGAALSLSAAVHYTVIARRVYAEAVAAAASRRAVGTRPDDGSGT